MPFLRLVTSHEACRRPTHCGSLDGPDQPKSQRCLLHPLCECHAISHWFSALCVRSFTVKQRAAPHYIILSPHTNSAAELQPSVILINRHHHFRRCGCCSCRSCQCYIHHRRSNQHSLPLLVSPSHLRQHYQSHRLRLLHHRSWCTTTTAPLLSPSSSLPLPLSLNHCHLRHCRHRFRHQQN